MPVRWPPISPPAPGHISRGQRRVRKDDKRSAYRKRPHLALLCPGLESVDCRRIRYVNGVWERALSPRAINTCRRPLPQASSEMSTEQFPAFLRTKTQSEATCIFMHRLENVARRTHWLESAFHGQPLDEAGQPCPWFTYSALHFLFSRDVTGLRIFEYGSGCSTAWWAANARSVVSVEHDADWFHKLHPTVPSNVTYLYRELEHDGEYARQIIHHANSVDIVVIDGRDRVNCAKNCVGRLSPQSVVIWDNSDRTKYEEGYAALISDGYRRIDFRGFGPTSYNPWTTSFFYKTGNCLGI
jgi:hypothetical protein